MSKTRQIQIGKDDDDDKKEPVSKFVLSHNLESGQIIVLKKNQQKHLRGLPGYEGISLRLCDKQGNDCIYFEATPSQADDIVDRMTEMAKAWHYGNVNFGLEKVDEAPPGTLTPNEMEHLEEMSAGILEDLHRTYQTIGSLQANLDTANSKISGLEKKCAELESAKSSIESDHSVLQSRFSELDKAYTLLQKGNFADAVKELVKLRVIKISDIEMFLSEIKDSGLDFSFIANPPESLENYVQCRLMESFGISASDLSKRLGIGGVEWQKSAIYMPESDRAEAMTMVDGLLKTIETADDSVKQLVADNLGKLVDTFRRKISEYDGRFAEWQKARELFVAYEKAMQKGKDDLASAKGLQACVADIRQVKLPVLAVPEQDGSISLYTPVSKGIIYDSLMSAVSANANISSEPQGVEGNTVLRITAKESPLRIVELLNSIKSSYQLSEAGKMGSRLGLILNF